MSYDRRVTVHETLMIAHNESLSSPSGDLRGLTVVGLLLDGWDDAEISFQASNDGVTWRPLCDGEGEVRLADPSAVNNGAVQINLDPARFAGCRYLKVQSGNAAQPVAQTPGAGQVRALGLLVREVA